MQNFVPHTKEELQELEIQNDKTYTIQYINKDYFNGEDTLEISKAKAIVSDKDISFIVSDPYGMDKFVSQVRVVN